MHIVRLNSVARQSALPKTLGIKIPPKARDVYLCSIRRLQHTVAEDGRRRLVKANAALAGGMDRAVAEERSGGHRGQWAGCLGQATCRTPPVADTARSPAQAGFNHFALMSQMASDTSAKDPRMTKVIR